MFWDIVGTLFKHHPEVWVVIQNGIQAEVGEQGWDPDRWRGVQKGQEVPQKVGNQEA